MKKLLSIAFAVGLLCGTLAAFGPAAASATSQDAALTHTEYKQLTKSLAGLRQLFHKGANLNTAYKGCQADGNSSALMKSEYGACSSEVSMFDDLVEADVAANRCKTVAAATTTTTTTATTTTTPTTTGTTTDTTTTPTDTTTAPTTTTGTTTTGTTTTPTVDGFTQTQLVDASCLNPDYQKLGQALAKMYDAAVLNRTRSAARGFKGVCLNTIGGTTTLITDEKRFAAAASLIAVDFAGLNQLYHGQTPTHKPSAAGLEDAAVTFDVVGAQYTKDAPPLNKLASCPHS